MDEGLKAALEKRHKGDFLESNRLLRELLLQYPDNALLHYECAWNYDILLQEEEAIRFYGRAIELGLSGKKGVNAYAQLGSMYRLQGRLKESEEILMEGMSKFWDSGDSSVLKTLYAFTMDRLRKPGEAMRWMTDALLDSSAEEGIVKNHRMLQYLGSNLDVPDIMEKLRDDPPPENGSSNDRKSIVEKVEDVLKVFHPTYLHGGWIPAFDHYEQHFTDPDADTRRAAMAAFAIMAGVWETYSAFPFTPQHERKYGGGYFPNEPHFELNGYIDAFFHNFLAIQQEFPVMTAYTVAALSAIDEESKIGLERRFPEMDADLFQKFREEILLPYRQSKKELPLIEDFLAEIGWNSSYSGW
ncbi:tetratricopeptide repeat protein [Planococcus sp. CAU13]|uniref:tetratricopeptide repeat protein n=1 Tax=Planococcus sp. CAU13 TaxID=1541197 RepID=UPI00052FEF65|nr:tetratricopeptide repeat protein [Planococcus sp. CAU13]